jgi:hypothetical protein
MSARDHSIARFIRAHTNYYDVVYSPDYEIPWDPPQDLAISRKRVYKVLSPHEIPVDRLPEHAVINVLISSETLKILSGASWAQAGPFPENQMICICLNPREILPFSD